MSVFKKFAALLFVLANSTYSISIFAQVNISGWANLDINSNLEKEQSKRKMTSTMELLNSLKLQDDIKINLYLAAIKNYQDEQKTELQNGYLSVVKKVADFGETQHAHTLQLEGRGYLPLNFEAYKNDSFRTRLYLAPIFTLNGNAFGLNNFKIVLKSALSRNFYQYNESKDGTVNTSQTWANSSSFNYNFTEKLSASAYFLHQTARNFNHKRLRDRYEMGQSLAYLFLPQTSFEIGHIIGGSTYKYNGVDNNIKFFNKNDSTVYSSLSFSF